MRKKLVAAIAAGAAAVLMLSGFDSAMTVQELQEKSKDALAQVGSLSASLQGIANAAVHVTQDVENGATMDVPMNAGMDMVWNLNMDPFQTQIEVNYSLDAMGQGANGAMQMYLVENEDGTGNAYMGTVLEDGTVQWEANTVDPESLTQVKDMVGSLLEGDVTALNALSGTGANVDAAALEEMIAKYKDQITGLMQIAPQSVNVNGKECYQLTGELSGDVLSSMANDSVSAAGQMIDETSAQMAAALLGGFRIQIDSAIDAQTFLPVSCTFDLGGSDFSAIEQMIVGSMMGGTDQQMSATLDVSDLRMTGEFACNEPVSVTVPQEALDAAASGSGFGDDLNPDDLIGGMLTGGTGTDITDGGTGSIPTEDGAVQNPDGSYRIAYEDYTGNLRKADINVPEGMKLSYGSDNYVSFANDDYSLTVSYSLFSSGTPEETVESDLDISFMEGNSDYSNVNRTEVMQTALEDGTPVYYGSKSYLYGNYVLGGTEAALQAGDSVVAIEIQQEDDHYNIVEVSEDDVRKFAGMVKPAAD